MPHPMKRRLSLLLLILCTALTCAAQGGVQIRRGPRTLVRGGTLSRPDTLARAPQPAVTAAAGAAPSGPLLDSLARMLAADSASRRFFSQAERKPATALFRRLSRTDKAPAFCRDSIAF